jgi:hypothetical protein
MPITMDRRCERGIDVETKRRQEKYLAQSTYVMLKAELMLRDMSS